MSEPHLLEITCSDDPFPIFIGPADESILTESERFLLAMSREWLAEKEAKRLAAPHPVKVRRVRIIRR